MPPVNPDTVLSEKALWGLALTWAASHTLLGPSSARYQRQKEQEQERRSGYYFFLSNVTLNFAFYLVGSFRRCRAECRITRG